jgi:uncharacterized protein YdeI (YjbR/CyaY-like superfamily)
MMAEAPENSIHPLSRQEWRKWLEENHLREQGDWLITYKKATGKPRMEYEDWVEEALCFGWVDSQPGKLDEERSMLWFAPRKGGSSWSRSNKERVDKLTAAGLMASAGLAKVEAAKIDGSWNALDGVGNLEIPRDLQAALDATPPARDHFTAFPRSVKRDILEWINSATKMETRASRVEETVLLAAQNIRTNQWRQKKCPAFIHP